MNTNTALNHLTERLHKNINHPLFLAKSYYGIAAHRDCIQTTCLPCFRSKGPSSFLTQVPRPKSILIFYPCLLKTTQEIIPSSFPFEESFVNSAQSGVNLFGWRVNSCPIPLLLYCCLIADSHFIAKPISSLGQVLGAWRLVTPCCLRNTRSLSHQNFPHVKTMPSQQMPEV